VLAKSWRSKPSWLSKYGAMIDTLHRKNRDGGAALRSKI
jgi:hypothetical protein